MKAAAAVLATLLMACAGPGATTRASKAEVEQVQLRMSVGLPGATSAKIQTRHHWHKELPDSLDPYERIAILSWKVQTAGAEICRKTDRTTTIGAQFEQGPGFTYISHVMAESPAEKAGIQPGETIVSINGHRALSIKDARKGFQKAKAAHKRTGKKIRLATKTSLGDTKNYMINPIPICSFQTVYTGEEQVNAAADGKRIFIHKGIHDIAQNDSQLIGVIAHEIAHNSQKHNQKRKFNKIITGILAGVASVAIAAGASMAPHTTQADRERHAQNAANITAGSIALAGRAWSKGYEREADYVGMYLAYKAGADLNEIPKIWDLINQHRKYRERGTVAIFGATHPSNPERIANLQKAREEIIKKALMGIPIKPGKIRTKR